MIFHLVKFLFSALNLQNSRKHLVFVFAPRISFFKCWLYFLLSSKSEFFPILLTLVNSCWRNVDPLNNLILETWKGSSELLSSLISWSETSYWLRGVRKNYFFCPHATCWNNHLHMAKIVYSHKNVTIFLQILYVPYKASSTKINVFLTVLHISDANYRKLCSWNHAFAQKINDFGNIVWCIKIWNKHANIFVGIHNFCHMPT